jgi:hypothetical protein
VQVQLGLGQAANEGFYVGHSFKFTGRLSNPRSHKELPRLCLDSRPAMADICRSVGEKPVSFHSKTAHWGLKLGDNQGIAVTDPLLGRNYKRLITCKLQAAQGSKDGLRWGGGWGSSIGTRD